MCTDTIRRAHRPVSEKIDSTASRSASQRASMAHQTSSGTCKSSASFVACHEVGDDHQSQFSRQTPGRRGKLRADFDVWLDERPLRPTSAPFSEDHDPRVAQKAHRPETHERIAIVEQPGSSLFVESAAEVQRPQGFQRDLSSF